MRGYVNANRHVHSHSMSASKIVIANWKSNKTVHEAMVWLDAFSHLLSGESAVTALCRTHKHEIVLALPTTYLLLGLDIIKQYPFVKLAAQNISMFGDGSYTGEVSARALSDIVSYSLVGHSERRRWFGEDGTQIQAKVDLLLHSNITPIVCVRSIEDARMLILSQELYVAYEPDESIGSGQNAPLSQVTSIASQIEGVRGFIYGGSVTFANVSEYTSNEHVNGVLVGRASLDPQDFYNLTEAALL